ncbi:MAG: PA14 domain-containing protein [Verrucomicrobiota bacterium]
MRHSTSTQQPPKKQRNRIGFFAGVKDKKFLFLSILVHLLLLAGATLWVVQIISPKQKASFKGGEKGPNQNMRVMEHKVSIAKKTNKTSSPLATKRVTTTGLSKVALPETPQIPSMGEITPTAMGGATGNLAGLGAGTMKAGGGGGIGFTMFGFRSKPSVGALEGTLYDFKQFKNRQPSKMSAEEVDALIVKFAQSGFRESMINKYYKSPTPLYITQLMIPEILSQEGPNAFGLKGIVDPDKWIVHYAGQVSPPESGTYYFVGEADDYLYIKFNGKIVMDSCWSGIPSFLPPTKVYNYTSTAYPQPFKRGNAIHVEAGRFYDMEVVIGDHGGITNICLLIEKEGVKYSIDAKGNPILPPFLLAAGKVPVSESGKTSIPVMENGPIWRCQSKSSTPGSGLDALLNPR